MISVSMLEQKMKTIPSFELSYETSSPHRKVYNENEAQKEPEQIGFFIPKSKKYLVWFTYLEEHDVAILIELGRDKKPTQYKLISNLQFDPNGPELAQGTLLYGSMYMKNTTGVDTESFFIIEDLVIYKSISLRKLCFGEKLGILETIFSQY